MKIKSRSLPEQVYEYMINEITGGRLKPGMKLNEESVCKEFGISRTPIREALLMLERDGMLIRKPRCGFYVREFEAREIEELYQCRQILECSALELGFDCIPAKELDELEKLIGKSLKNFHVESSMKVDEKIHKLIVDSCPNRYMRGLVEQLVKRTRPFRLIRSYSSEDVNLISMERKNIIMAIKNKDKNSAIRLLGEHICHGIATKENL